MADRIDSLLSKYGSKVPSSVLTARRPCDLEQKKSASAAQLVAMSFGHGSRSGTSGKIGVRSDSGARGHWLVDELLRIQDLLVKHRTKHGDLRHYLVLPAGESLLEVSSHGIRPVGTRTGKHPRRVLFSADEIAAPTLPKSFWPTSQLAAWGFSVEDGERVLRNHLFFRRPQLNSKYSPDSFAALQNSGQHLRRLLRPEHFSSAKEPKTRSLKPISCRLPNFSDAL